MTDHFAARILKKETQNKPKPNIFTFLIICLLTFSFFDFKTGNGYYYFFFLHEWLAKFNRVGDFTHVT